MATYQLADYAKLIPAKYISSAQTGVTLNIKFKTKGLDDTTLDELFANYSFDIKLAEIASISKSNDNYEIEATAIYNGNDTIMDIIDIVSQNSSVLSVSNDAVKSNVIESSITQEFEYADIIPASLWSGEAGDIKSDLNLKFTTSGLDAADINMLFSDIKIVDVIAMKDIGQGYEFTVSASYKGSDNIDNVITNLEANKSVVFAEKNIELKLEAISDDPAVTEGKLWGMGDGFGSNAKGAWEAGFTGNMNTVMGIVDTGIDYTHKDLYQNIWLNQREISSEFRSLLSDIDSDGLITFRDLNNTVNANYVTDFNKTGYIDAGDLLQDMRWENGLDEDGNGYKDDLIGWDFASNTNNPLDDNKHGTHVAGTIGGIGGNEEGVAGINWSISMMALKFLDASGGGTADNGAKALNYYAEMSKNESSIENFVGTNNSWGGGGYSKTLYDSILNNAKAGQLVFAAAGNSSSNNDTSLHYPSNYNTEADIGYDAVVAVAAIEKGGNLAIFSSYGATTVDLAAPGMSVYSTLPNNGYKELNGTSMATPHVAGAAALYAAYNSGATALDIKNAILNTTAATASLDETTLSGGRLDILNLMQNSDAPDNQMPGQIAPSLTVATATLSSSGAKLSLSFSKSLNSKTLPEASYFEITVNGQVVRADSVSIDPSKPETLDLILPITINPNDALVVSYKDPTANDDTASVLQSSVKGIDVVSFTQELTNEIKADNNAPKYSSILVDEASNDIIIHFSEPLKTTHLPSKDSFEILLDGVVATINSMSVNQAGDLVVKLQNASNVYNSNISVNYQDDANSDNINALQDYYGNDVASFSANFNKVVASIQSSGTVVTSKGVMAFVKFDQPLDANTLPTSSAFNVKINGETVAIDSMTLNANDNSTLEFLLSTSVYKNDIVTIGYNDPTTSDDKTKVLQGAQNQKDVASFEQQIQITHSNDAIAPVYESVTFNDGANIRLHFSEQLKESHLPQSSNFNITLDGKTVAISSFSIDSKTGDLLINFSGYKIGADFSQNSLKIEYIDSTPNNDINALQDYTGNDVASFSIEKQPQQSDAFGPKWFDGKLKGFGDNFAYVELSEEIDLSSVTTQNLKSLFSFTNQDGTNVAIEDVTFGNIEGINGYANHSIVKFTLAQKVNDGLTLTYNDNALQDQTSGVIQDKLGNDMAAQSLNVWSPLSTGQNNPDSINTMAVTSKWMSSNSNSFALYFSNKDTSASSGNSQFETFTNLDISQFQVIINGVQRAVEDVFVGNGDASRLADRAINFTLKEKVGAYDGFIVKYSDKTSDNDAVSLQDVFGNDMKSFEYNVATNSFKIIEPSAPAVVSTNALLSSTGAYVMLNFDKSLDANALPDISSFEVLVNGKSATIETISLNDKNTNTVELKLSSTIASSDKLVVSYKDLSGANDKTGVLQGANGVDIPSFSQNVTNSVKLDTVAPKFVSMSVDSVNGELQLHFSEALKTNYLPNQDSFNIIINNQSATISCPVSPRYSRLVS